MTSPYKYHYYLNVVTHGYSTPYWDWQRWQEELDWMALHGMDMPLLSGAYEAIIFKVFKNLGLTTEEINRFFTGPAHLPWNRMGNITKWDGPLPVGYLQKQEKLFHQILKRVYELGMHPIVPSFAGFVPKEIQRVFPSIKIKELSWGGFDSSYAAHILLPNNELFTRIGGLYIKEWEKEFGTGAFYLADSFNEMEVPPADSEEKLLEQLSDYGDAVYKSIANINPKAIWVMMGWTFPYFRDKAGELFWTPLRLSSLIKKVPDDKLLILDLANEYNKDFWKIDPSWKTYDGFFNKMWIYSFIPNMGGKTAWNGILKTYVEAPIEALQYASKGNLVGYGTAPEGIDNNGLVYELISDMGYSEKIIDLDEYIKNYCINRYGAYPANLEKAFNYFRSSCYGTFTDHPLFNFQTSAASRKKGTVNSDSDFFKGVNLFLSCSDQLKKSTLYQADAIELSVQYLGLTSQQYIYEALNKVDHQTKYSKIDSALILLNKIDRLLLSHPTQRLDKWISWARNMGNTTEEKNYYESNAKRIITTWGGNVNDYSARMWSGLISSYYAHRMQLHYNAERNAKKFNSADWEEEWIKRPFKNNIKPYSNPLKEIKILIEGL